MVESKVERYAGHPSLASMVHGHIDAWRNSLMTERAFYQTAKPEGWRDNVSYINHELSALSSIEKAVQKDLNL